MKNRVSVGLSLSPSLMRRVRAACDEKGTGLSVEIEARLRASFDLQGGDELLLLKMDSGLLSWLNAFAEGCGLFGDLNSTAVFFLRSHLQEMMRHDVWFAAVVPKLPEPIRGHVMSSPHWQALMRGERNVARPNKS